MMRYSSSRIQQDTRLVTVDYLIHMVEIGRLDPNPTVGSLPNWPNMRKSQMVESLILGLPIETIWAEQDALGKTQLLSGFEVLSNILDFKNNHLRLKGLRVLKHLEGLHFSEIDYAEQKHFMQMEVGFSAIHHDSDPMLKCLFVESINRAKHGTNAAQLARNIIFKRAASDLSEYTEEVFDRFDYDSFVNKRTVERYYLKLQTEILYCLLLIYLEQRKDNFKYELSMESYSYSRSHISNYSDYDNVEISFDDDLENAINKIMFMLEVDSDRLHRELRLLDKTIKNIFDINSVNLNTIGKNWSSLSFKNRKHSDSLLEHVYYSISNESCSLRLNRLTSISYLMDRLK
ncbi:hypothetical protein ACED51_16830 [Photobacterium swingsii]|uniref:hypothetical protein n=1 Tax=Photobacterium swingsii TaxID=680026 RepID=UPI00352EDB28